MAFGKKIQYLSTDFLVDAECPNCKEKNKNTLTTYCQSFVTGPIIWFAWGKDAFIDCKDCKTAIPYHEIQGDIKNKSEELFKRVKIPTLYRIAPIILLLALMLPFYKQIHKQYLNFTTPPQERMTGEWWSESAQAQLIVFDDQSYALLADDSTYLGKYTCEDRKVKIKLSKENNLGDYMMFKDTIALNINTEEPHVFALEYNTPFVGKNPFTPELNQWRNKAKSSENRDMIKKRVINYLQYVEAKYKWTSENHLKFIKSEKLEPVLVASNGIQLDKSTAYNWHKLFYNQAEEDMAYQMLDQAIPRDFDSPEKDILKRRALFFNQYVKNAQKL